MVFGHEGGQLALDRTVVAIVAIVVLARLQRLEPVAQVLEEVVRRLPGLRDTQLRVRGRQRLFVVGEQFFEELLPGPQPL